MCEIEFLKDLKNVLYVDRIYNTLQILQMREQYFNSKKVDLRLSELRLFSQNGEDGVLNALLRIIGDSNKYFVEFGVGDGWSCNTRLLAEIYNWNGLFLEINAEDFQHLKCRYRNSEKIRLGNIAVTPENINTIFESFKVPANFGVLSIDIDGQDFWVWEALNSEYQPDIVIIEYNSLLDPLKPAVEPKTYIGNPVGTKPWGASLYSMKELGMKKGYRLVHLEMAGVNAFFVKEKIIKEKQLIIDGVISGRSPNYGLRGRD